MIRDHLLVYDDYLYYGPPVYTGVQHMQVLGRADQLGLHAVVDNVTLRGELAVAIEHSTDGINWTQKSATPEISSFTYAVASSMYAGEAYPARQSLEYVRLQILLKAGREVGLRVYATLRDRGKGPFPGCGCHGDEAGPAPVLMQPPPPPREESHRRELRALVASRPHAALDVLARRLAEVPARTGLNDRLQTALAAMPARPREAAARYLVHVAALEAQERRLRAGR